MSSNKICNFSF